MSQPDPNNPFAYRKSTNVFRRWGWGLFIAVILAVAFSPQLVNHFLLSRLSTNWDQLPTDNKVDRLLTISQLGLTGIPLLVQTIGHDDPTLARTSFEILQQMQEDAASAEESQRMRIHQKLVTELRNQFDDLPINRYLWISELLDRTVVETLDSDSALARNNHATAQKLLARIALEPDPSTRRAVTQTVSEDPEQPVLVDQGIPDRLFPSTDSAAPPNALRVSTSSPGSALNDDNWVIPSRDQPPNPKGVTSQNVSMQAEMISTIDEPSESQVLPIGDADPVITGGSFATRYPLEAYSTRAVIDLLSSVRKPMSAAARSELVRRGFSPAELGLAVRLSNTNASVRLALVDEVPHRTDIDPRQWLLWLAEDGERSVRLQALASLGTINDPAMARQLRNLLRQEQDQAVADKIRQTLLR